MPAKKRGKGFTRKKQHKNSTPSSSAGGGGKKVAAKKPPKTPKVERADSATSSKRKGKELVSSAPRRVSPRLLEIRTRKMSLENGSLVPTSMNTSGLDHGAVTQPPVVEVDDHPDENHEENGENENHRGKQPQQQQQTQEDDDSDDDEIVFEDQEDPEQQMFERGTGPVKQLPVARISVTTDVREVEEDYTNHAVLLYFWKTGGVSMTRKHVKEWIYNNLGDKETIGAIRYCRDLSRGFFFVYFEHILARRKALANKPQESGLQVIVFPWCSATVNSEGEQCTPRMIVLPGLPDQYLPVLPNIGNAFGTYIGSIGALDPDADLNAVRGQSGWESAYNSTVTCESGSPRIAVMMPPEVRLPSHVELQVRAGVTKKQPIYEQLPQQGGVRRGAPVKRAAGQSNGTGTPRVSKRLKA